MHTKIATYIRTTQERNDEAVFTVLSADTAICNHNVGNLTLEYISIENDEITRTHIPFDHVKMLSALVAVHNQLNKK